MVHKVNYMTNMHAGTEANGLGEAGDWLRRILGTGGERRKRYVEGGEGGKAPIQGPESRAPYDYPGTRWRGGPQ
jgi:hypothetical protein